MRQTGRSRFFIFPRIFRLCKTAPQFRIRLSPLSILPAFYHLTLCDRTIAGAPSMRLQTIPSIYSTRLCRVYSIGPFCTFYTGFLSTPTASHAIRYKVSYAYTGTRRQDKIHQAKSYGYGDAHVVTSSHVFLPAHCSAIARAIPGKVFARIFGFLFELSL